MRLENIAAKILVNSLKYKTEPDALSGLKQEFKSHFPMVEYESWNKEVPDAVASNIINNVGKNSNVSVRFVIKDLEIITKNL